MKILFTDVDGVYNTPAIRALAPWAVEEDRILAIQRLCAEKGVKVVISSSWRNQRPEESHALGFPLHEDWRTTTLDGKPRGEEVEEWLSRHPEATAYAILDDKADFLPHQMSHLIQTNADRAITDFDVADVGRVLDGEAGIWATP